MTVAPIKSDPVRGFLHDATAPTGHGLVLTHGAGANCEAPLLIAVATAFAAAGIAVLRIDLPFRQRRPTGPPPRGSGDLDRAGLKAAVAELRTRVSGPIFLGGHSYGGRQATMLAADEPAVAAALLLFSYPLHPPKQPERLRTEHLPRLATPAVFVHGSADPFGSLEEVQRAIALIPAPTTLIPVIGAAHDLRRGRIDLEAPRAALLAHAG